MINAKDALLLSEQTNELEDVLNVFDKEIRRTCERGDTRAKFQVKPKLTTRIVGTLQKLGYAVTVATAFTYDLVTVDWTNVNTED